MKLRLFISVLVMLAALSLAAACTGTPDSGTTPTATTPVSTTQTPAATAAVPLTPEPTETIPSTYGEVDIQAQKDPISNEISVIFRGGKGQSWTQDINVTVVRSTGEVVTSSDLQPVIGSQVDIAGTRGDDRVIVTVTLKTGNSYRVYDQVLKGR
ncbi:hypothetical protein FGU65_09830 [Methanoculleus sp. FWC-SCC1]|uniref:Uncharacterized protein n=1 Tax=Methanoculleus frigidifontis TaxID=2584085 RepID=A0ABT8MBC6_9EURY|nr:hypothetical protein [Methanoculleus sp. FWC-SCC1]MDN7025186.1 hypothetical protein [Methanoculleus sp. FWC-SCC1]